MQDRNEFHLHHRVTVRQHYAEANAPQKPRLPIWVKGLAIAACIGLGGALTAPNAHAADAWTSPDIFVLTVALTERITKPLDQQMTDITNPVHTRADVEEAERIRQELAISRGLAPRDYSHYTPRPEAGKKKPGELVAGRVNWNRGN